MRTHDHGGFHDRKRRPSSRPKGPSLCQRRGLGEARFGVTSTVAGRLIFMYRKIMKRSISRTEKRGRGRPRTNPTSVHLSLAPDLLARIDQFLAAQMDTPSRPEVIRRLIELALGDLEPAKQLNPRARSRALDLASKQIDKLIDPATPDEERQVRKRRLLKGPREFRDIRDNIRKPKS